jgi:hypothetical protein
MENNSGIQLLFPCDLIACKEVPPRPNPWVGLLLEYRISVQFAFKITYHP